MPKSSHPFFKNAGHGWGEEGAVLDDATVNAIRSDSIKKVPQWSPRLRGHQEDEGLLLPEEEGGEEEDKKEKKGECQQQVGVGDRVSPPLPFTAENASDDDGAEVLPSSADHTAGGGTLERRALAIVRETHSQYKLTLKEALADEVHFLDGLPASVDASAVEREAAATHAKHTALWSGFGTPGLPWPEPIKAGARFPSPIGWEIDNKKLQFTLEQARHTEIVRVYRYRRKLFSAAVAFAAAVVFPVISLYTFKPMINDRSYRAAISEASFGNTALAAIAIFLGMINALPYCIFVCVFFDGTALPPRLRTCCFGLRHCGGCCDASMRCGCFPRFITAAKQTSSKT